MNRKPFLVALAELIVAYRPKLDLGKRRWLRMLLPTPGNVLFTLLVVAGLLWASSVGALPLRAPAAGTSTGTIAYQGRLADSAGDPITETVNMEFRLYDVPEGGVSLWTEQWTGSNAVRVSDGLFNIMLGSLTPIPQSVITGHDSLFLGITVGTDDEMSPRVQLGTVPFAVQALTVPDGSVTTDKIADGAVTQFKAPFAAEAYWGSGGAITHPGDMKTLGLTLVHSREGGQPAEAVYYDVSSLGFSQRPHAVCQIVNAHVATHFCHADWDGSTNDKLLLWIRRYDGGNVAAGHIRLNVILFGR